MQYHIGVFDSGVGGLSVAQAIEQALPDARVQFVNDQQHVPYGSKPVDEVYGYVVTILQQLVAEGCQVIVIACNTVTTNLIGRLRQEISVPLVGMEPMIKPAAEQTKSGIIAVCATPSTLRSPRYAELKERYATGLTVLEPDCSNWAAMIEGNQLDHQALQAMVNEACQAGADVIVLGCTHYHWIQADLQRFARGRATIIQPEAAVVTQLQKVLAQLS